MLGTSEGESSSTCLRYFSPLSARYTKPSSARLLSLSACALPASPARAPNISALCSAAAGSLRASSSSRRYASSSSKKRCCSPVRSSELKETSSTAGPRASCAYTCPRRTRARPPQRSGVPPDSLCPPAATGFWPRPEPRPRRPPESCQGGGKRLLRPLVPGSARPTRMRPRRAPPRSWGHRDDVVALLLEITPYLVAVLLGVIGEPHHRDGPSLHDDRLGISVSHVSSFEDALKPSHLLRAPFVASLRITSEK